MEVTVERRDKVSCKLSVNLSLDEVRETYGRVFREYQQHVQIPGFRAGKAPKGIVEARYKHELSHEATDRLVETTLPRAITDHNLRPVTRPKVRWDAFRPDDAFSYTAEMDVHPEIEIKKYVGLEVARVNADVTDANVVAELDALRARAAQVVPVLLRDRVETGDLVVCDYETTIGGVPIPDGTQENMLLEIGNEEYLPGLSDGLLGAQVPSARTVSVRFPEDAKNKDLAGRDASMQVTLKELKVRELPALDDEFAKDLGEENLEHLKEHVLANLKAQAEKRAASDKRQAYLGELVRENPFEVPESMIEAENERLLHNAQEDLQRMIGKSISLGDDALSKLKVENRKQAEFQIRAALLLSEVARVEHIHPSEEDIQARIDTLVAENPDNAERLRAYFARTETRQDLAYQMIEEQTLQYLYAHGIETDAPAEGKD